MIDQIPSIYGFSTIVIGMMGFIGYTFPFFLIACAVGVPLAGFAHIIKRLLQGPRI